MAQGVWPRLLKQVIRTILDQQLFDRGHHLLVAVSGGPDSVALLLLLATLAPAWRLKLTVIHFNYGLRGGESDADEAFVASLCRERQLPLVVQRPVLTKRRGVSSLQALAREVRYNAMKCVALDIRADRILTGHTANDQAETMLMWMLRGAGMSGLKGMPFVREGIIVRPLLKTTREELLNYLSDIHAEYRQDSSNASDHYRRNRIRGELLPVMARITPSIVRLLERQSEVLRADEEYLEQLIDHLYGALVEVSSSGTQRLARGSFAVLPPALQRRLTRRMLRTIDPEGRAPTLRTVEDVRHFACRTSKGVRLLVRGAEVVRDRDRLLISPRRAQAMVDRAMGEPHEVPVSMAVPATVYWPGTEQEIHVQVVTRQAAAALLKISRDCTCFDADRLSEPLVIRRWRAGDRIHPRGMGGKSKKLQDLFTDMKIGRRERNLVPLLVAPQGVLWVVGRREDERFLANAGTTRCLVATVKSRSVCGGTG